MNTTIHDTPIVRVLLRRLALMFFALEGWKVEGQKPGVPKYVIIAAPHTSNWDFLYTVCMALILEIKTSHHDEGHLVSPAVEIVPAMVGNHAHRSLQVE